MKNVYHIENNLNLMINNNEFIKLFPRGMKYSQVDAIRDTLKVIDINGLKQINQHIIRSRWESGRNCALSAKAQP